MGYCNAYSISRWTWKWTNVFHLLAFAILSNCIIFASCCSELSCRDFRLVRDMLDGGRVQSTEITLLDIPALFHQPSGDMHILHWPDGLQQKCCSTKKQSTHVINA